MVVGPNMNNKMQACIDACSKCSQACYECFSQSLKEADINPRKDSLSILIECAMMCQMSVAMMSMNGQFSKEHCELCAKICDKCAEECEKFEDEHSKKCAEICRQCAEECRKMAAM